MISDYLYPSIPGESSPDPRSNTGSDSQNGMPTRGRVEAHIDALTVLWTKQTSDGIDRLLSRTFGMTIDRSDSIGRKIGVWWDRNYSTTGGSLLSERSAGNGKVICRLAISGSDCARVGNYRLAGFMLWCQANLANLRCSRIDIALDDYAKKLELNDVERSVANHQHAGFKKGSAVKNYGGKWGGHTVYLGKRNGNKMVRAYDKYAESKGKIDSIRWELELHDEYAQSMYQLILSFPKNNDIFQRKLINYATGAVAFVEHTDKNISRCKPLDWWKEWLEFLNSEPLKIVLPRRETSLQKSKEWVYRQVSKTLCMLKEGLGVYYYQHFLEELLIYGESRMTNLDRLKISDFKYVRDL